VDLKLTLCEYLTNQRDALLWKLDGVSEKDLRMPMTVSGTNLLGVVKHLAGIEAEYFGDCVGRPFPHPMPWWADDAEPNADMWATAEESPEHIIGLYRRATEWADTNIAALPLDAPAHVPWWEPKDTTLYRLLVHMIAETARHAGHLDILREAVDGRLGMRPTTPNLPRVDEDWWPDYVARLRKIAENAG
jgi:hypothetical protein